MNWGLIEDFKKQNLGKKKRTKIIRI